MHHLDIKPSNILFNYVNKYENWDIIGDYNNDIDKILVNKTKIYMISKQKNNLIKSLILRTENF